MKINPNSIECPVNGFDPGSLNNPSSRAFERAQRIVRTMAKQICILVSPSNPSFKYAMMDKTMTIDVGEQLQKIQPDKTINFRIHFCVCHPQQFNISTTMSSNI